MPTSQLPNTMLHYHTSLKFGCEIAGPNNSSYHLKSSREVYLIIVAAIALRVLMCM